MCWINWNIHNNTHIVLLTRNVLLDRQILPQLADTPAPYIGVIGSRRRWQETKKLLLADGKSEADLATVSLARRPGVKCGNTRRDRGQHYG